MSLVSGLTFGGLLVYGATRTSANPKDCIFLLGELFSFNCHVHVRHEVSWHGVFNCVAHCYISLQCA